MVGCGYGVGQDRALIKGHLIRQTGQVSGRSDRIFRQSAVEVDAQEAPLETDLFVAREAIRAGLAGDNAVDGDPVPCAPARATRSYLDYFPAEFMAQDDGLKGGRGDPLINNVNVRTADPAGLDPNQDFLRSGLGPRNFFQDQRLSDLIKTGSFHELSNNFTL
jgi:hypothetical protein